MSTVSTLVKSLNDEPDEESVRRTIFRSMEKIERHLARRDPAALRKIYSSWPLESNQNAAAADVSSSATVGHRRRLRFNSNQGRHEQYQINMELLKSIKVPDGVAIRSLLVPTPSECIFTDADCHECQNEFDEADFQWLDTNVSNAEECSRRAAAREAMRQSLVDWIFLYFRVQRRNWEQIVVQEKMVAPDVNMYAEEQINKWTMRLRFKMLRLSPVKVALMAFLSRMGLIANPGIVFCRDGFFGLGLIGSIHGSTAGTPRAQMSFNATPRYLNMKNGDNIFVSYCNKTQMEALENARVRGKTEESQTGQNGYDEEFAGEGDWSDEDAKASRG